MKTNPLNNIKIASPCSADWDEMRGDNRKRYCSECSLHVYNLSEMTQHEAENLLFEAEGRICVRLYRRNDGTVITQDCPVGWRAIKQSVSRIAAATFSLLVGFFGGVFAVSNISFDNSKLLENVTIESQDLKETETRIVIDEGGLSYENPIIPTATMGKMEIKPTKTNRPQAINGRISNIRDLQDETVELWIK